MNEPDRIIDAEVVDETFADPAYGQPWGRPYDYEGQWSPTGGEDFDAYTAPPQPPQAWDVPVADGRGRRRRMGAIGAVTLITAAAAVGAAVWLHPAGHTPPPHINAVQLPAMALDTAFAVPGVPGWIANSDEISDPDVNPPQCAVVYAPVNGVAITGVSEGVLVRKLTPYDPREEQLVQTLLAVDTPEHAQAAAAEEVRRWTACGGVKVAVSDGIGVNEFTVEPVETVEGVATTQWDIDVVGHGWGCQRAVTAWRNVLIDVSSCGQRSVRRAVTFVHQIIERGEHLGAS